MFVAMNGFAKSFRSSGILATLLVGGWLVTCSARAAEPAKQKPASSQGDTNPARYWPQWRGPLGTGFAPHANPPVEWSETNNIRWKLGLPGKGHSTPVVWGDRIFVTTAVPVGEAMPTKYSGAPGGHDEEPITHRHQFMLMALNRR